MSDDAATSYYEVLGVPEGAAPEEIKRAYYRLIRSHRPSDHPDLYQRFNDAYHVLSDRRRRTAYDQTRHVGRRVQAFVDQAVADREKDTQKAISMLNTALRLAPDLARPRQVLAQVLMHVGEHAGAEEQFVWLVENSPRDEQLRLKYAHCLVQQERFADAEAQLKEALAINPLYYNALLVLANVCEAQGRIDEAAQALETAIAGDGFENVADVDALMRLMVLYLMQDGQRAAQADAAETRLRTVIDEAESRRRDRAILAVCHQAQKHYQARHDAIGIALALMAQSAAESDEVSESVREEANALVRYTTMMDQARRIVKDKLVAMPLRDIIRLKYLDSSSEATRKAHVNSILADLQTEITDDPRGLSAAIDYLRREYEDIATDQNAFLQELTARIQQRLEILGPDNKYARRAAEKTTAMPGAMPVPASSGRIGNAPADAPPRKGGIFGWLRGPKQA